MIFFVAKIYLDYDPAYSVKYLYTVFLIIIRQIPIPHFWTKGKVKTSIVY